MSLAADREQLIKDVVRLRRAEHTSPAKDDIAAVRIDLERAAGATVTRAVAARLLGVSQTALDRWIERGEVPAVITPRGRRAVPLRALVDLVNAVGERERTGDVNPLASVLRQRRTEAERLDLETILPRRYRRQGAHRGPELRSLAYHRAVARRLDDRIVGDARECVRRWRSEGKLDDRYAEQWEAVLAHPLSKIARMISRDDQRGRDLRQNSPFAGVLSEQERQRVLEVVR